ncbi:TetR/AcrR family transcriptional regulator [Actinocrispum wychmicini]|uniref:TetR family transcriptional regulator n=1 Tax=Actinocrispum wychmicini TaxID=1213861 RepID=A0A4V2S6F1_9PSEU|nr:TetR/AcrR family transcriptional regulator [Actinocrispum wychmicini]TCO55810.1 TetR family transcriptional regulator [Actinocrispum wychmicini]
MSRSTELLWGSRIRAKPGPRPALSLEQITTAAVAIADAEGLARLSMGAVAQRLGSGTASLYRYVPGKAELVDVMVDTVVGDPPPLDDIPGGWRPKLDRWARGSLAVFTRHPWALQVVTQRRVVGPRELAWFETALRVLAKTKLTQRDMVDVITTVNGYVRGAAPLVTGGGTAEGPFDADALRPFVTDYPAVAAALDAGALDPSAEQTFTVGLNLVLDGVDRLLRRRISVA